MLLQESATLTALSSAPATSEPMRAAKALELDPPPQFPRPLLTESPDKLVQTSFQQMIYNEDREKSGREVS